MNANNIAKKAENAAEAAATKVYNAANANAKTRRSLGQPSGDTIGSSRLFYPSWRSAVPATTGLLGGLFSLMLGGFVLMLILVFIHYTIYPIFSFSPNDKGLIPIPTASDKQVVFSKAPAAADLSANFVKPAPCEYTMGFDLYSLGDFPLISIPRVLVYRNSKDPVSMDPNGDTAATLVTRFPTSNLVIWMDPVKNDLFITVFTQAAGGGVVSEQFGPIENVKQRAPVRVTLVFSQTFIEVYLNGKLQLSAPLKAPPRSVPADAYFYGPVKQLGNNVMIGNLTYFPRHLTAREITAYESEPVAQATFFTEPAKK